MYLFRSNKIAPEPHDPVPEEVYHFLTRHYLPKNGSLAREHGDYTKYRPLAQFQNKLVMPKMSRETQEAIRERHEETQDRRMGAFGMDRHGNPLLHHID